MIETLCHENLREPLDSPPFVNYEPIYNLFIIHNEHNRQTVTDFESYLQNIKIYVRYENITTDLVTFSAPRSLYIFVCI